MILKQKSPDKEINKLLRFATYRTLLWYGISIFIIILAIFSLDINSSLDLSSPYFGFLIIFGFIDALFAPWESMDMGGPGGEAALGSGLFLFPIFSSIVITCKIGESLEGLYPVLFLILLSMGSIVFWSFSFGFGMWVNSALIPLFKDLDQMKENVETEKRNIKRLYSLIEEYPTITQLKECYDNEEYQLGLKMYDGWISISTLKFYYENLSKIMMIPKKFTLKYNEVDLDSVDNLLEEIEVIKQNSHPDLDISFSKKELKPNGWNKVNLIISNNGNSFAYGIKIKFSEGLKISGLSEDIKIKTDPISKELSIKPMGFGNIAVNYSVSATYDTMDYDKFEKTIRFFKKDYLKKGTFWLEIPEDETSKGKIHISGSNVNLNKNVIIKDSIINRSNINSREPVSNITGESEDLSIEDSIVNRSNIGNTRENTKCSNCGYYVSNNMNFCPDCGERL